MADNSLKVIRNKNIYTIDLKDENDEVFHTLEFHIGDANFPIKMLELYDDAMQSMKDLEREEERIKKELLNKDIKEVEEIKNMTVQNIKEREKKLDPTIVKFFYLEADGYKRIREILDKMLGVGSCQKIFGDNNDKEEFIDFLNALLPEFEKMGVKIQDIQQNMYKKYAPKTINNRNEVI